MWCVDENWSIVSSFNSICSRIKAPTKQLIIHGLHFLKINFHWRRQNWFFLFVGVVSYALVKKKSLFYLVDDGDSFLKILKTLTCKRKWYKIIELMELIKLIVWWCSGPFHHTVSLSNKIHWRRSPLAFTSISL